MNFLFCVKVVGVCPSSERLHMTDCTSFKWDISAWCHISIQQISRSIWSVRTDNSSQRSHHKLLTKSVITQPVLGEPLRWLMNWETENWFGWVERVGYEASVAMGFFFLLSVFLLFLLWTPRRSSWGAAEELLMLKKPISLTSSFMCSVCFCCALGCCGKMAHLQNAPKSLRKICFIFI